MNAMPIATFVVEPVPVKGYRVTNSQGGDSGRLHKSALQLLDLLGQPNPTGPDQVHAWLGPLGQRGEYVRVVIERLEGGEFRYRQAWYSDKGLPAHPARCGFGPDIIDLPEPTQWPSDINRVVETARRAADSGVSEWMSIPGNSDGLVYCRALTEVLGTPPANRLTWITHAPAAAVPVHLQLVVEPKSAPIALVNELPGGEQRLRNVFPVAALLGALSNGRNGSGTRGWGMTVPLVIVVFIAGAVAGWFGKEGLGGSLSPLLANTSEALAGIPAKSTPPQPDPKTTQLRDALATSQPVRQKLQGILAQDGIAAPNVTEPGSPVDSVQLVFLTRAMVPVVLKNTEIKQWLDCLKAMEEWQQNGPPANKPTPR